MRIESLCLGPLLTNCYILDLGGTVVVIDPADATEPLRRTLGRRSVDLVINTHGHFDHVGGDWPLQREGARIAVHHADMRFLDEWFPDHPPVDHDLAHEPDLVPGLRVVPTPGHSPGSVTVLTEGGAFCGDLLFRGSIGRTDFPGGSFPDIEASLQRLLGLPDATRVFPGHGPPTTIGRERLTNPYLGDLKGGHRV